MVGAVQRHNFTTLPLVYSISAKLNQSSHWPPSNDVITTTLLRHGYRGLPLVGGLYIDLALSNPNEGELTPCHGSGSYVGCPERNSPFQLLDDVIDNTHFLL